MTNREKFQAHLAECDGCEASMVDLIMPENPSPELLDYWQSRSELFTDDCFEIGHIVENCE